MERFQEDLRARKVCERCVLRLSGEPAPAVAEALGTALSAQVTEELCPACLGALQYPGTPSAVEPALEAEIKQLDATTPGEWGPCSALDQVAEAARKSGHSIDEWSITVQAPGIHAVHTAALWRQLQKDHPKAEHFRGTEAVTNAVTVKDVAGAYVSSLLKNEFQACKGPNGVAICLTWAHPHTITGAAFLRPRNNKRPRGQAGKMVPWGGYNAVLDAALAADSANLLQQQPELVPCKLCVKTYRPSVLVGGRYLKMQRGVPQTRWLMPGQKRDPEATSVEEELGAVLLPVFQADSATFVSAGREDVDVRMLGTGRPFVLQVVNAKAPHPSEEQLRACEAELAARPAGVLAQGLQLASQRDYSKMKDGETEKRKHYRALCWADRELQEADEELLNGITELVLQQDTPTIHSMKCKCLQDRHWFVLELVTQAGTYIKEFCHGDFGRCQPSVGSLLGKVEVQIAELDVMHIALDIFN